MFNLALASIAKRKVGFLGLFFLGMNVNLIFLHFLLLFFASCCSRKQRFPWINEKDAIYSTSEKLLFLLGKYSQQEEAKDRI